MSDWDDKPKLPTANLSQIERWRQKFEDAMIPEFVAEEIVSENYKALTQKLSGLVAKLININLPKELDCVDPIRVEDSMAQTVNNFLGGRMPAPDTLKDFAAVLAGNLLDIKVGRVLQPWCGLETDEWHAARIVAARRYVTPRKKILGALLTVKILTGAAAAMQTDIFSSRPAMYTLAKRLGVMAKDEFRLLHPRELVGIYSMVMLSAGDELKVKQYYEKQSMSKRNKDLTAKRAAAGKSCESAPAGTVCHFCPAGTKACPMATHRTTYERKTCKNGHQGWLPEDKALGFCLDCERRIWHARRGR